jgi:cytochrome P450
MADTVLPRDARVMLLLGAANRDPDAYPDPDRFDLDHNSRTLGFGLGPHFCLGAPLARLEARTILGELAKRVDIGYDIDADRCVPTHTTNVRGFSALPTTVKPR